MDEQANEPEMIAPPTTVPPLARYRAEPGTWVDVLEAIPRCRVQVADGAEPVIVEVNRQRELVAPDGVIIDYYPDDPEIRDQVIEVS